MSELLIFLLMIVIFAGSCFFLKLPVGIALLLSSVGGALAGGFGVPVKFMVEGTMSFLDTILVIACAMIFMKCIQYSGALDMLNRFFLRILDETTGIDNNDVRFLIVLRQRVSPLC